MSSVKVPSRQEMFDRAWAGLKSQGWVRSVTAFGTCTYFDPNTGTRCAWGWVDPENTRGVFGTVGQLRGKGVGIAAELNDDDLKFAQQLQNAHDFVTGDLRQSMVEFARTWGLVVPTDE